MTQQTPAPAYAPLPEASQPTNTLAIVSLITSFFVAVVGIILGHIALSQIGRTGEKGRGLAIAGLIIGYVSIVGSVVMIISFLMIGAAFSDVR